MRNVVHPVICAAALAVVVAAPAWGQGSVGSGPLTEALTDIEPTTGVISIGRVRVAPGVVVREIGWDSNVFDEAENPKEDFIVSVAPDAALFARLRFLQVSAYVGGDFNHFQTYEQENSAGHSLRGRADVLLSRFRPFVAGGRTDSRTRPNGEIDVRADRVEEELSGGVAFDISRYGQLYGAAYQFKTRFHDAFEDGVNLSVALNRDSNDYSAGLRTDLTPLLALVASVSFREELFRADPIRNAQSWFATADFRFDADAVVAGQVVVSFEEFTPVNPAVQPFRGLVGGASLIYSFLEVGRIGFSAVRRNEFSFNAEDAYYIENGITLSYTHRLFGYVDAQVKGSRSRFDYGYTETSPARQETLDIVGASVGYNLRNRTRISVNYEFAKRRSPQLLERNYDRRRAFLAWNFAY
jgi:hypothetical protein